MGVNNGDNVTLIIITVVVDFIVCQLPLHLNRLVLALHENTSLHVPFNHVISTDCIGDLLVCVNSSVNFLIYCLLGKKCSLILV